MWRLTALLKCKEGVTRDAFAVRWKDLLGPLIVAGSGECLRKLIVNPPPENIRSEINAMSGDRFDLMIEFWFANSGGAVETLVGMGQNPQVVSAAAKFVDPGSGVAWLSEVKPSKPENGGTGVKFTVAGQVADGWSIEDAQKYWETEHPRLARSVPQVWEPLTRYTQFHGRRTTPLQLESWLAVERFVPMCADVCVASQEDLVKHFTNEAYLTIIRPDEQKFGKPGEMLAFLSSDEFTLAARAAV